MSLQISNIIPQGISSKFGGLQKSLAKTSIRITFQAYLGLMVFSAIVSAVTAFIIAFIFTWLLFSMFILSSLLISILFGFVVFLGAIGMCYMYPMFEISSRTRKIDANLPLTANFMAVLASAGMPPERIFRSLANVGDEFCVGEEIRRIIADIELLGLDLNSALKSGAMRSASRKFGAMLDGIITTSHMGGDLAGYLREESEKYKKLRVASMKSYLESLGGMAEVYVSIMIALPLALVVMLSIMSFLGGGGISMFGNIDPQVLLLLVAFVITPAGVCFLLLMVDSMTPPR